MGKWTNLLLSRKPISLDLPSTQDSNDHQLMTWPPFLGQPGISTWSCKAMWLEIQGCRSKASLRSILGGSSQDGRKWVQVRWSAIVENRPLKIGIGLWSTPCYSWLWKMAYTWGVTNLLTGMIPQVGDLTCYPTGLIDLWTCAPPCRETTSSWAHQHLNEKVLENPVGDFWVHPTGFN